MFERQTALPSPEEILSAQPLPKELAAVKRERDRLCEEVLTGNSEKLLFIVGPCSAHDPKAVLEYVKKLGKLNEQVKDKLVLIPRIYTNKPRSRGVGYKGMFFQPELGKSENILKGIRTIRELHMHSIEESGLTAADEMLFPENYAYIGDLITYHAVGARSSEDPLHRVVASGLDAPVGFKNPMSGSASVLVNSIFAAQNPQVFNYHGWQVKTEGNPLAHAVLRGKVDSSGNDAANYHYENVMQVYEEYKKADTLKNPAVIIDANHSNSGKRYSHQPRIVSEVMLNRSFDRDFRKLVKGFMVESFLVEGNQPQDEVYGKSITDPCLGWEETEKLILTVAERA